MDEEIAALAQMLGHVEDGGLEALRALCHPARLEVAGWLKAGVAPEDCGGAFPLAAAWVALAELAAGQDGGVAERYRLPGAAGTVGLIRPLSRCFCRQCNRIRLTADGCLKPCLHSREELPLRGLHGEQLRAQLERAILHKPEQHAELSARSRSQAARDMNQIGG